MRLDLADLRLFLSIVEAGSITRGAEHANLALASASERLRSIEEDAGMALLERRPRGVVTTEAGEALAHHARVILRQQGLLRVELRAFAEGTRGKVRLHANTSAMANFLPSRLGPWLASRQRMTVELKERSSEEIVRTIVNDLGEAGVVSNAVDPEGLTMLPVAKDHLVLIASPAHRIPNHASLALRDVVNEPFVGLAAGTALQDHLDQQAIEVKGHPLKLRIRLTTFEGVCELAAQGIGLAIVPQDVAARHRRRHGLRVVALTDDWARRQLCLCFRDWAGLSAGMRSLLEHLGATSSARRDA